MTMRSMNVDDLLQHAKEDLNRNRLGSAEKTLEQAVLLNNQVPEAFYLLGHVYSKTGKLKKAIRAFERTLSLDPSHTDAAIAVSSLYNDVGKYDDGASIFLKTKKRLERVDAGYDPRINRGLAFHHFELGNEYMKYERFSEAQSEFSKAVNLEPGNVSALLAKAKCMAKLGDRDGAILLLRNLIELHSDCVGAKVQLGLMYHGKKQLDEAFREWNEALALDPENRLAQMYVSMFDEVEPQHSPSA